MSYYDPKHDDDKFELTQTMLEYANYALAISLLLAIAAITTFNRLGIDIRQWFPN